MQYAIINKYGKQVSDLLPSREDAYRVLRKSIESHPDDGLRIKEVEDEPDGQKVIILGDADGSGHNYSVEIGSSSYAGSVFFRVNGASCEQDALDKAVDYCEENDMSGLFWDDEDITREYPDDFITAGNHCHLLPRDQVVIHSLN